MNDETNKNVNIAAVEERKYINLVPNRQPSNRNKWRRFVALCASLLALAPKHILISNKIQFVPFSLKPSNGKERRRLYRNRTATDANVERVGERGRKVLSKQIKNGLRFAVRSFVWLFHSTFLLSFFSSHKDCRRREKLVLRLMFQIKFSILIFFVPFSILFFYI